MCMNKYFILKLHVVQKSASELLALELRCPFKCIPSQKVVALKKWWSFIQKHLHSKITCNIYIAQVPRRRS